MAINRKLLLKSMSFSLVITVLLMVMSYLPIWSIMKETEGIVFPVSTLIISMIVIFCILTAVFYFDVRRILER